MEYSDRHPIPSSQHSLAFDSEIKRSKRDAPPAHFILKIKSFSLFPEIVKKTDGKYESDEFEAGDHKWKLVLHPNGNRKTNGEGHISLYLASTDKNAISGTSGGHINVLISFFVYDHIQDKYLTIQDGKIKRYHVLRTENGFDQLIPLAEFSDPKNGYVVDDCCVFGAEVHVIKNTVKGIEFSLIKKPKNGTFTWKIHKLSTLEKQYYDSEVFKAGGCKWKLRCYPKGDTEHKDRSLSLFLCLDASPGQSKVYAEYNLLVKDQVKGIGIDLERKGTAGDWFEKALGTSCWGYRSFMLLTELGDASKGFVVNDTLVIEVNISLISVSEDLIS